MREIPVDKIISAIKDLCINSNYYLGDDIVKAINSAIAEEESTTGKEILNEILENAIIADNEKMPLCQDCGIAVIFIEIGQDVHVTGGNLREAINEGVRQGYKDGYLRKSLCHPISRKNTQDNTPAVIHFDIVPGDKIKISIAPKGGGSENMSRVSMLSPSEGIPGIKKFVIDTVEKAGGNPCPPIIVGIGVGGTLERSTMLAKRALIRELGNRNQDPELAKLENEILENINKLGIGPMGYGGSTTCLDVFLEMEPCHIASLPVAVNINCHSARHKEAVI